MVSLKSVEKQLKSIHFNQRAWGRTELSELPHILMPDEEIFECVNGYYEGGFALLCATNIRLLLIDKKPLKYLTVEDVRFEMINQIDYSHRLLGAHITVSTGIKSLRFTSYNQQRLRKLIDHIQNRMAEAKQEVMNQGQTQQQHLEKINEQLQAYLLAQHEHQEELRRQLEEAKAAASVFPAQQAATPARPIPPSPEISDYLFSQSLLKTYGLQKGATLTEVDEPVYGYPAAASQEDKLDLPAALVTVAPDQTPASRPTDRDLAELYQAGRDEIFKKYQVIATAAKSTQQSVSNHLPTSLGSIGIEINPFRIAYSKLPMVLRNRKYAQRQSVDRRSVISPSGSPVPGLPMSGGLQ
ncbi:MAG: PH domain-containing protein [Candidatus Saccharibacteria bacterium]